jgi:hypothetical protein
MQADPGTASFRHPVRAKKSPLDALCWFEMGDQPESEAIDKPQLNRTVFDVPDCSKCRSARHIRIRRAGWWEQRLAGRFNIRRFRCMKCGNHFWARYKRPAAEPASPDAET